MVHTGQFYIMLESNEILSLEKRYNVDFSRVALKLNNAESGITFNINYRFKKFFLYLTVDFIKLLDTSEITPEMIEEIYKRLNKELDNKLSLHLDDFVLLRLDYRYDAVVRDENDRKLLLSLYKKSRHQVGYKIKDVRYKTTIKYNSKCMQVKCYDKMTEREASHQDVEYYEDAVLRYEVVLANSHLNYMSRNYKLPKNLRSYLSEEFKEKYLMKNLVKIFYTGDYHKMYHARKKIESSNLKTKDKNFLIKFLVEVSTKGFEGIESMKNQKDSSYSKYLVDKAVRLLSELNINPILIPKNTKDVESIVTNPLRDLIESQQSS